MILTPDQEESLDQAAWTYACIAIENPQHLMEGPFADCVTETNREMMGWWAHRLARSFENEPDDAPSDCKRLTVEHFLPWAREQVKRGGG